MNELFMSNPYLGQIILFAGNFAPSGWAFCNGQLLSISQYSALFSIIGTFYGGNGTSTFALPDLRSRVPIGMGQGTGLSSYTIGQAGGSEKLTAGQLPVHSHTLVGTNEPASSGDPTDTLLADSRGSIYGTSVSANNLVNLNASSITGGGSASPSPTLPPYLALNYIIALQGIYPSQS